MVMLFVLPGISKPLEVARRYFPKKKAAGRYSDRGFDCLFRCASTQLRRVGVKKIAEIAKVAKIKILPVDGCVAHLKKIPDLF
jgi:hypothetical protein